MQHDAMHLGKENTVTRSPRRYHVPGGTTARITVLTPILTVPRCGNVAEWLFSSRIGMTFGIVPYAIGLGVD